jgi:3-phosphoshikimate 1-carboxyvinyltransferase
LQQAHELKEGSVIDVGAAGTAMRFSAALLTMLRGEFVLTGSARMKERPIGVLVDALRKLGADIDYVECEGFPPLRIKGYAVDEVGVQRMQGGSVCLPGHVSSQYVSALLMLGPMLPKGLQLTLTGEVVSRPYIDMTLHVMGQAGAQVGWTDDHTIEVKPILYNPMLDATIENDWSAASYWYETLALDGRTGSEMQLHNLWKDSSQGDAAVQEIFAHLGVETAHRLDEQHTVVLKATGRVCSRLDWDFVKTPDLAQTVVVTCCMMGVPFHFTGLQSLKIKETDRIVALQKELQKLGFVVGGDEQTMWWNGEKTSSPCQPTESTRDMESAQVEIVVVDTYKDHRMAMSFAPCALKLGHIAINEPLVVTKSYPSFWEQLKGLGFEIEEQEGGMSA